MREPAPPSIRVSKFARSQPEREGSVVRPTPFVTTEGTVVAWENTDLADHTATSNRPEFFNTGTIAQNGGQGTVTIDAAGTFGYHCIFHSSMVATARAPIC